MHVKAIIQSLNKNGQSNSSFLAEQPINYFVTVLLSVMKVYSSSSYFEDFENHEIQNGGQFSQISTLSCVQSYVCTCFKTTMFHWHTMHIYKGRFFYFCFGSLYRVYNKIKTNLKLLSTSREGLKYDVFIN